MNKNQCEQCGIPHGVELPHITMQDMHNADVAKQAALEAEDMWDYITVNLEPDMLETVREFVKLKLKEAGVKV